MLFNFKTKGERKAGRRDGINTQERRRRREREGGKNESKRVLNHAHHTHAHTLSSTRPVCALGGGVEHRVLGQSEVVISEKRNKKKGVND